VSFQDVVNRNSWRGVGFSGDGEYVAGGLLVKDQNQHHLHLWNGVLGNLKKVLEGEGGGGWRGRAREGGKGRN
jgi:hypothetical protein